MRNDIGRPPTRLSPQTRCPGGIVALAVILWAAGRPAHADAYPAYFTGPPATSSDLIFGAAGQLTGSTAITTLGPLAGGVGPTHTITDGSLSFTLGRPAGANTYGGFDWMYGGSITLTGSFDGGPQEVIFASAGRLSGGSLVNDGANHWSMLGGSVLAGGVFADDVQAAYHGGLNNFKALPAFAITFTGTPGEVEAGAVVRLGVTVEPFTGVPEPASAAMVGVGVALAGGVGGVRLWRRRAA